MDTKVVVLLFFSSILFPGEASVPHPHGGGRNGAFELPNHIGLPTTSKSSYPLHHLQSPPEAICLDNHHHVIQVDSTNPHHQLEDLLLQPTSSSFQDPSANLNTAGSDLSHHHVIIEAHQPQQATTSTSTSPSTGDDQLGTASRRIAAVYRSEGLGRAVLGYVVPVTLGLLALNTRPSPTVVNLVLISTGVGFTAIWNGLLLRHAFPRFANRIEQLGVADVLAAFFGLLSTYLPPSLAWMPWLCWALAIAPLALTFSTSHKSPVLVPAYI